MRNKIRNKDSVNIIHTFYEHDGKIIKMHITKTVKKHGGIGYISLPKELIGKRVDVQFDSATQDTIKEGKNGKERK